MRLKVLPRGLRAESLRLLLETGYVVFGRGVERKVGMNSCR